MIDIAKWNEVKRSSGDEIKRLMEEIEVLCLDIAIEQYSAVPSERLVERPRVQELAQKIAKLPKEVRPPQGTNTAALLFAELLAGRLAQRMLKKGKRNKRKS